MTLVGGARLALAALLAAAGLALAVLCVQVAAGGVFAQSNPARALRWRPGDAAALSALSVATANAAETDTDFATAARLARQALRLDPLNGSALRILALEAERHGQDARALGMMDQIGRRTRRDTLAQAWLMNREFEQRRYATGFAYADAILQRQPEWGEVIYPVLTRTFADPAARTPLFRTLAQGPEWRRAFLAELVADAEDADALEAFFVAFKTAPAPLEEEETGLVVGRLIDDGRFDEAQTAWRKLLDAPARAGGDLVYDGDFRGAPGGPPFNWGLASDASAVAERVEAPDGAPALYVRFPASEPTPLAEQLLVLAPGDYVLTGRVLYGKRRPERLAWGVQCAGGEAIVLSATQGDEQPGGWRAFEAPFTVPASGCPGQWLQLGSRAEEDFGMVDTWFGDIAVRPRGAEPSPGAGGQ